MYLNKLLILLLALSFSGCSLVTGGKDPVQPPETRRLPDSIETVDLTIPRGQIEERAASGGDINRVRFVEVFRRGQTASDVPEYRVFNVQPGSLYELVGLRTSDIIVSASNRTIFKSDGLPQYIRLLERVEMPQIEIRRAGKPILLRYSFVEAEVSESKVASAT